MIRIRPLIVLFFLPVLSLAQVKNFELTNPLAIELTDSCVELLVTPKWRTIQIETDVRGTITETEGRGPLKYHEDGTFDYRYSGRWEIIDGKYIRHRCEDGKDKEMNFGGIYAVVEISPTILTLSKILTSSNDMVRTMFFESTSEEPERIRGSFLLKPIFSAPMNYFKGRTDPASLDSISKLSMEHLFTNDYLIMDDTIYLHTPDSLYQIRRTVQ